jgi:Mg-chelatase subunit ChlD
MRREWRLSLRCDAADGAGVALASFMLLSACSAADHADPSRSAKPKSTQQTAGSSSPGASSTKDFGNAANAAQQPDTSGSPDASPNAGARGNRIDAAALFRNSCASARVPSDLLPSNLLFVLDRSGSMVCNPPPTTASDACEAMPARADASQASKWEITTAALTAAITALPADTSVGLSYFSNDDACGVNSQPSVPLAQNGTAQRAAIGASLASAKPGGGTPLVGATILAYKYLHAAALAGAITGNQFVVLITDGAQSAACSNPPSCVDAVSCTDLLADQEVPKAASPGAAIRTFVIGVPGSESARSALSRIAKNGGTAPDGCDVQQGNCHFDMTMVADLGQALSKALTQIAGQTLSCEVELPAPEQGTLDLKLINVVYTPHGGSDAILLYQDNHAGCDQGADGWQYAADNTKIRLCGPTCDNVRADPNARVEVVLGCPVQGPQ